MSILSIRLPDTIHKNIKKISELECISINQFITNAVTEKITAIETESLLQERSKEGNLEKYLAVLQKVKNIKADDSDI
ncbi:MAG TPA: toxin-antitoxin system HicB family antitoxin [Spirochaetota bacterium]|nr:toxin-antitoxin system HicB family antitoxin [Spirochaetota bacterium]